MHVDNHVYILIYFLIVERQLQQTSLKEWVSRKKSSGSTGTPDVSIVLLIYSKWLR